MNLLENSRALQHLIQYRALLRELIVRDLKVKYRRSFLGYLWSLLNPLMMMVVMTVVFSFMFRFDIENYPLYLICGNTLWTFFSNSTTMAMYSVLENGQLIRKVYIPKFIFPISRVLSAFVTTAFSLAAILIVMLFTRSPLHWEMLIIPVPLCCLLVFSIGIGMALAALAVYFRDVVHLYGVVILAWMYATPIFYPMSQLPEWVMRLIKLNPMYHYINFFRELVLYGNIPGPNTWFACIASCLVFMVLGLAVFRKLQRNFILYL